MNKKILIFGMTMIIAFLPVCNNSSGNKTPQNTPDTPAVDPSGDDPVVIIRLESLQISAGSLTPVFNPDSFQYEVTIKPDVSELIITAIPSPGCSAAINTVPLEPDEYSTVVPVLQAITDLEIPVSAGKQEGEIYSLRIRKMEEKLIENSSFELFDDRYYPAGWRLAGAGEVKSAGEFYNAGSFSGTFSTLTSSISGREILSATVEIDPAKNLNSSARFYIPFIDNVSPERIKISLKLYYFTDAAGETPASTPYDTMAKVSLKEQGVWEKINYDRLTTDIPADARFIRISLRACFDSTKGGTKNDKVYFDDVSVQQ